ncbi:hypothetical protein [Vreelandella olivaria]|uniref:hypothetical protein n=1 Tax=Vreelandella olivaria TaxID=390919 RepID=UPI00201FAB57|nr:hypothetical protein [Halomonas olivaria]
MPRDRRTDITMDAELETMLRRVRAKEGLDSDEAAIEYLLSRGVRIGGYRMTGRGRALYPVGRNN